MRVLGGGAVVLLVCVAVLLLARPALAGSQVRPMRVGYHVVMPGETLMGIAAEVDPGADPRDVALQIMELNARQGSTLTAGERLAVPVVP